MYCRGSCYLIPGLFLFVEPANVTVKPRLSSLAADCSVVRGEGRSSEQHNHKIGEEAYQFYLDSVQRLTAEHLCEQNRLKVSFLFSHCSIFSEISN